MLGYGVTSPVNHLLICFTLPPPRIPSSTYWFVGISSIFSTGFSYGHVFPQPSLNLSSSNFVHGVRKDSNILSTIFAFDMNFEKFAHKSFPISRAKNILLHFLLLNLWFYLSLLGPWSSWSPEK